MKKILIFLGIIFASISLCGQDLNNSEQKKQKTVFNIQKNSLYVDLIPVFFVSGFYERTMPIGDKSALIAGTGLMQCLWENTTDLSIKGAYISGKTKHFFECGALIIAIKDKNPDSDLGTFCPNIGYRYQAINGFLFRGGLIVNFVKDYSDAQRKEILEVQPGLQLSLGYSF